MAMTSSYSQLAGPRTALNNTVPFKTYTPPAVFTPPEGVEDPLHLFTPLALPPQVRPLDQRSDSCVPAPDADRLVRYRNIHGPHEMLVFADGSCFNNGIKNDDTRKPIGGVGVVYTVRQDREDGMVQKYLGGLFFALEHHGPEREFYGQTNNRAELRSVIAALQCRPWAREATSLVLAVDSQYVSLGCTKYLENWQKNGWRKADKQPVLNKDLWVCLLDQIAALNREGLRVSFWWIPRAYNLADALAKEGSNMPRRRYFARRTVNDED